MGQFFTALWSNKMLMAALIAWAAAQVIKTAIYLIVYREWRAERLWGSGGMPSSHSATVCALTTAALLRYGVASPAFAVCFILTAVVLHDARGVRLETGKQARLLTAIAGIIEKTNQGVLPEVELKELVGHTPLQVAVGAVMGIVVGLLLH